MKKDQGVWVSDLEADDLLEGATRVWCGVFKNYHTREKLKFEPDQMDQMVKFMEARVKTVIGHNYIAYDIELMAKVLGYRYTGKVIDTLVLSRTLRPNRRGIKGMKATPHSLEAWGVRVGRGKPEHEDWSQYSPEMMHRCDEDVEINLETYDMLLDEMDEGGWEKAMPMTMKLFEVINKMTTHGWLVDQDHMHKSISMLNHWTRKIDNVLEPMLPWRVIDEGEVKEPFLKSGHYNVNMFKWFEKTSSDFNEMMMRVDAKEVGGPFCRVLFRQTNLNSNKETKEFLLDEGWVPQEYNHNKDGEETSPKMSKTDPFHGLEGGIGKLASKRVQIRQRYGIINGWFGRIREDGRLEQRITGLAVTGRAKHQVIVNVPNGEAFFGNWMRRIFTVPEDKVLLGVDADSCQNRMLANRVGDPAFTKTILEGNKKDKTTIHYVNQAALREAGYEVSYGNTKNIGYAFNFGATDKKLGSMVRGKVSDGTAIRAALLGVSAGLEQLLIDLKEEWMVTARRRKSKRFRGYEYFNGALDGLDGRPIRVASPHALLVYQLQSDEAIMMSLALLFLYKWANARWTWGKEWAVVAWNHDEFQCEIDPDIVEEFKRLAEKSIAHAGKFFKMEIPQIGEASLGRTWADTH